jgi:Bacterial SH3 domain
MMRNRLLPHVGLLCAALLGCTVAAAQGIPQDTAVRLWDAVRASLRERAGPAANVRFRDMETYQQAAPGEYAVCGKVSLTGRDPDFVYFVSVAEIDARGMLRIKGNFLVSNGPEARYAYAEITQRCIENGRGQAGAEPSRELSRSEPPPSHGSEVPPEPSTQRMVTMRQGGNLRAGPGSGHPVLRIVPRGTVMQVFGEAPGGWYQVGDTQPWGWMHVSMLAAPPQ